MPIDSRPDHVAAAVPSIDVAAKRWHDQLSGAWVSPAWSGEGNGFATRQLRYRGGSKLELLSPVDQDSFAAGFLAKYGSRVHHVTLKVPEVLPAVEIVRAAGYDVVDVNTETDVWHEAFLRPSQVGGVIVQLAWTPLTDQEWVDLVGGEIEPTSTTGPQLIGPTIFHPDLESCAKVWEVLGGQVEQSPNAFTVSWDDEPLQVRVERSEMVDPPVLRFTEHVLPADPDLGPATVTA